MQPEQKKARIEKIKANRELKRNMPSKDSIAMENPAYIATEQEVSTSPCTVKHGKHVTAGERQTLLHRHNEEFAARQMKSSQEDRSMSENDNDDNEPPEQPEVTINGKNLKFIQYSRIPKIYETAYVTNHLLWTDIPLSIMFPSIKEADAQTQTAYNDDHSKVAFWPGIPTSMCPTIKEVNARIQSFYNNGHGKVINFIFTFMQYKNYILKNY
ncbi:unnamed protein product [Triticum turgidum subsp. durum]|uniref:Uncharacterized protein n=1 Tax=Triticum turgidum subsp. durum TaxID=4567 RepID=A0A9R0TJZ3_TRITD|nr:unnamed protein product [Triticum turgidum subsp. durum]